MDTPESTLHSFIVKLWLEDAGDEVGTVIWHGHITHVPSGERRYLRDLDSILSFVKSYISVNGADVVPDRTLRGWLKSWMRRKS
jgi:hypothetical protein